MVNDGLFMELLYYLCLIVWCNLKVKVIEFGCYDNICNLCNIIIMVDIKIELV